MGRRTTKPTTIRRATSEDSACLRSLIRVIIVGFVVRCLIFLLYFTVQHDDKNQTWLVTWNFVVHEDVRYTNILSGSDNWTT